MLITCRKRRLPSQAVPCSASSTWLRRQDLEESGILPALLAGDYGDCAPGKLPAEEVAEECAPCHPPVCVCRLGRARSAACVCLQTFLLKMLQSKLFTQGSETL